MSVTTRSARWPELSARTRGPVRLLEAVLGGSALARSRRSLLRLDDHMLRDIGLTRAEAETEALRPDWDAPLHWRG